MFTVMDSDESAWRARFQLITVCEHVCACDMLGPMKPSPAQRPGSQRATGIGRARTVRESQGSLVEKPTCEKT